jgi:hypothetical protein
MAHSVSLHLPDRDSREGMEEGWREEGYTERRSPCVPSGQEEYLSARTPRDRAGQGQCRGEKHKKHNAGEGTGDNRRMVCLRRSLFRKFVAFPAAVWLMRSHGLVAHHISARSRDRGWVTGSAGGRLVVDLGTQWQGTMHPYPSLAYRGKGFSAHTLVRQRTIGS